MKSYIYIYIYIKCEFIIFSSSLYIFVALHVSLGRPMTTLTLRVVNGPGRAGPTHFYLVHRQNGLGIMSY